MAESDTSSSACRQLYDRVQAQRVRLLVSYRASPRFPARRASHSAVTKTRTPHGVDRGAAAIDARHRTRGVSPQGPRLVPTPYSTPAGASGAAVTKKRLAARRPRERGRPLAPAALSFSRFSRQSRPLGSLPVFFRRNDPSGSSSAIMSLNPIASSNFFVHLSSTT